MDVAIAWRRRGGSRYGVLHVSFLCMPRRSAYDGSQKNGIYHKFSIEVRSASASQYRVTSVGRTSDACATARLGAVTSACTGSRESALQAANIFGLTQVWVIMPATQQQLLSKWPWRCMRLTSSQSPLPLPEPHPSCCKACSHRQRAGLQHQHCLCQAKASTVMNMLGLSR